MREVNKRFVEICLEELKFSNPVFEFGALQVHEPESGTQYIKDIVSQKYSYVGCDMRHGPGVDQIQNLHDLDLPDGSVGSIITLDTLEHVEFPRKALSEMFRVLKPGGLLVMTSVFEFPIHGYPDDYWRFTPNAFKSLLREFTVSKVYSFGVSETRPQVVAGIGFKSHPGDIANFERKAKNWEIWFSGILKSIGSSD